MMVIFIEEDDEGVVFSHNDKVVKTLNVEHYDVHYILINNESLVDVLYSDAIVKMGIFFDRLTRMDSPLIEFTGDAILVEGKIFLTIRMGGYPL